MLDIIDQEFLPETSGFLARPSGSHFAGAQNRAQHALDVVISLERILSFDGTLHAISQQEDAHVRRLPFRKFDGKPKSVVWTLISVGAIVDNEQVICLGGFGHGWSS
jgi:hypothetical protein